MKYCGFKMPHNPFSVDCGLKIFSGLTPCYYEVKCNIIVFGHKRKSFHLLSFSFVVFKMWERIALYDLKGMLQYL